MSDTFIWNQWIGYTKPLMDFRNDGPYPSPPDTLADGDGCIHGFWHRCEPPDPDAPDLSGFDGVLEIVPPVFDTTVEVTSGGFDAVN